MAHVIKIGIMETSGPRLHIYKTCSHASVTFQFGDEVIAKTCLADLCGRVGHSFVRLACGRADEWFGDPYRA